MGKKTYIVRFHKPKHHVEHTSSEGTEDKRKRAKMKDVFGEVDSFIRYTDKHGMHFSEKLSSFASSMMVNDSEINKETLTHPEKPKHSWSANEVEEAIKKLGLTFEPAHKFDYHYAANMAYADFFGRSLKEETLCIRHAHAMVHDPDGYPELVFSRWLCDVLVKEIDIDWDKFI